LCEIYIYFYPRGAGKSSFKLYVLIYTYIIHIYVRPGHEILLNVCTHMCHIHIYVRPGHPTEAQLCILQTVPPTIFSEILRVPTQRILHCGKPKAHVCIYTYMNVYAYVYIYVYTYIYLYTYTTMYILLTAQ